MKLRIASLTIVLLALVAMPAFAQTIYDNGPTNGTTDGWTINFGFAVSDSFTLSNAATVTGLDFAAWVEPGDVLQSAEVSITSSEFGGTSYFDQTVSFTPERLRLEPVRLQRLHRDRRVFGVALNSGTYWLRDLLRMLPPLLATRFTGMKTLVRPRLPRTRSEPFLPSPSP